jgi:uncharacterized membrane protein YfcA
MPVVELLSHPWLLLALFAASALYAAVGHGGASAYLAVLGLAGMDLLEIKPVVLILNIGVSALAFATYAKEGHFRTGIFWPLAAASIPAAFLGGMVQVSHPAIKLILAAALLLGAWRMVRGADSADASLRSPARWALLALGAVIGLLSGLIGIGGGVFLTPLLLVFRWCETKPAAAVSASFIFANSISGLAGLLASGKDFPMPALLLLPVVLVGGWIGSRWGSLCARVTALRRALAVVLLIAAAKFIIL